LDVSSDVFSDVQKPYNPHYDLTSRRRFFELEELSQRRVGDDLDGARRPIRAWRQPFSHRRLVTGVNLLVTAPTF